ENRAMQGPRSLQRRGQYRDLDGVLRLEVGKRLFRNEDADTPRAQVVDPSHGRSPIGHEFDLNGLRRIEPLPEVLPLGLLRRLRKGRLDELELGLVGHQSTCRKKKGKP